MSHSVGAARFGEGGEIFYFEYVGSTDVADPRLRLTEDEVWERWRGRRGEDEPRGGEPRGDGLRCLCPDEGAWARVELVAFYGSGFHWEGRACRRCLVITEGLMPYGAACDTVADGQPAWSPWLAPAAAPDGGREARAR